jgi:predicted metal-dependent enzyme (double-stranded beta helix superfamily)
MPHQMPVLIRPSQLALTVQAIADTPSRWLGLIRYDPGRRWYLRLAKDDEHEIWLLSWLPGQRTGFHDHGASAGAFAVAIGALSERTAPGGRPEPTGRIRPQGAVRSFGPRYVHDVANLSAQPAVSVHAYSPPLASMRHFQTGDGGLLVQGTQTWARSW